MSSSGLPHLAGLMRAALIAAFVTALAGAFLPGRIGTTAAVTCVAVLVAAPVVRVAWLTWSWLADGDRRFAALGAALLAILAVSAGASLA